MDALLRNVLAGFLASLLLAVFRRALAKYWHLFTRCMNRRMGEREDEPARHFISDLIVAMYAIATWRVIVPLEGTQSSVGNTPLRDSNMESDLELADGTGFVDRSSTDLAASNDLTRESDTSQTHLAESTDSLVECCTSGLGELSDIQ